MLKQLRDGSDQCNVGRDIADHATDRHQPLHRIANRQDAVRKHDHPLHHVAGFDDVPHRLLAGPRNLAATNHGL